MIGKLVYLLVLVAAVAAIANAVSDDFDKSVSAVGGPSHHLIVGSRTGYDQLVVRSFIVKESKMLQIVKETRTFAVLNERHRITQIKALDQKTNGNGAYASLLAGGPGLTNVTIKFKSQRGHGINFVVELYAQ